MVDPITFHVEAAGELSPVILKFAATSEVRRVRSWRRSFPDSDAGEFAALSAKRWFYYAREGAAATTLHELQKATSRRPSCEIAFLLVASAPWMRNRHLALAYCRRSWSHHLILDFLAVHPGLSHRGEPIRGIGSGVIFGLVTLANRLGVKKIWGEATANSAKFYERILQQPVEDLFIISDDLMPAVVRRYHEKSQRRLAELRDS